MKLDPSHFDEWFRALHDLPPEQGPFPWQRRLFREWLCAPGLEQARWPRLIKLPTAAGKTAVIDLAVLALAVGSPCARRRIAFVVDRRVVVDEAAKRAGRIAERLRWALDCPTHPLHQVARSLLRLGGDEPLVVAALRGGIPRDDGWARSPAQPTVVLSTVDQLGSRLLFRAYGGYGPRSWPIQAGLVGRDTLIIVDEAHCAKPFCETVLAIADRWQRLAQRPVGEPIAVVRMSATPGEQADFELHDEDVRHEILQRRFKAPKLAELVLVKASPDEQRRLLCEELLKRAHGILEQNPRGVLAVVVNRVGDARAVFEQLRLPEDRKILLTGRVRGWERDQLLKQWLPFLHADSRKQADASLAVVATQCIEVGANLDFDFLVTEIASLDALRQRFGRLDRLGERAQRLGDRAGDAGTPGVIVAASSQVSAGKDGQAEFPDPVYGHTLRHTWEWLVQHGRGQPPRVDFGIHALEGVLPPAEQLARMCLQGASAYPLLPAHLDLLCQTSPAPEPDPEFSAFLHGSTRSSPDVTVIWRADLPEQDHDLWLDRVAVQPPAPGEGCAVPIWEAQRWLSQAAAEAAPDAGDIEGAFAGDQPGPCAKPVVRWRGATQAELVPAGPLTPGDVLVVPSGYGGCDRFGWNPAGRQPVQDVGDAVAHAAGRRPVLRLNAVEVLLGSIEGAEQARAACADLARWARGEEDAPDPAQSLARLASSSLVPDWLRELAQSLAADRRRRAVDAAGAWAIVGRRSAGEDLNTAEDGSCLGVSVSLAEHSTGVSHHAECFAKSLGLADHLVADLALAAWLHDVGKADPRFQVWLHRGDEVGASLAGVLLAKSAQHPRNRAAIGRARVRARYPEHARHEAQSLALIDHVQALRDQARDWDLVRHLIVSHHGFGRPFVPVVADPEPVLVELEHGSMHLSSTSDHRLHTLDSGIAERYWLLVRRYGWWGLAWLEAILRLADQRRSKEEEQSEVDDV